MGSVERSGVPDELLQPVGGWRIERPMRDLQCLLVQRKSDGVDEVTLGGEAAVDGADSNLRAAGNLLDREGRPLLIEDLTSGGEDTVAVAGRVLAQLGAQVSAPISST